MDPIDGLSHIAQIFRQKLAEKNHSPATKHDIKASKHSTPPLAAKPSAEEIKRKISERIQSLNTDEDQQGRIAAQIFVETILTWEFGEQLLEDPEFTELSSDVATTMWQDPHTWQQLKQVIKSL